MAMSAEDWDDLAEVLVTGGIAAQRLSEAGGRNSPSKRMLWKQADVLFAMAAHAKQVYNAKRP